MASSVLLSTLLTGIALLAIAVGMLRFRRWKRGPDMRDSADFVQRATNSPAVWTAGFVLLALGFGAGVVAIVSGTTITLPEDFGSQLTLVLVPFLVLLGLYVFAGIYSSAKDRGLSSAPAVGMASAVVGLLVLTAIVVKLLVETG